MQRWLQLADANQYRWRADALGIVRKPKLLMQPRQYRQQVQR